MVKKIINLTQHNPTPEQIAQGVVEPDSVNKKQIADLLTFNHLPTIYEIKDRARKIAEIASNFEFEFALIGGAPYLMSSLERELKARGIIPLYSFSVRRVVENLGADGRVTKTSIFEHAGFVEV